MEFTFRQISTWPGNKTPPDQRKRSQFSAKYNQTLRLLSDELTHLRATNVVIEADCDASMIRRDGQLRADARMRASGIIVSFDSKNGPMRFPCDKFLNWDCNLRAIALTLEHLCAVDRYGVTHHAEQYKGWAALPDRRNDKIDATTWLATKARDVLGLATMTPEDLPGVVRDLKIALHPDRRGSSEEFKQLNEVLQVLGL